MIGKKLPAVTFRTRVRDETVGGPNPYRWSDRTTDDYFAGRRVVIFSLPGAFTPTCSTYQLPDFERLYQAFRVCGGGSPRCCPGRRARRLPGDGLRLASFVTPSAVPPQPSSERGPRSGRGLAHTPLERHFAARDVNTGHRDDSSADPDRGIDRIPPHNPA
jgi:hypothetical protein